MDGRHAGIAGANSGGAMDGRHAAIAGANSGEAMDGLNSCIAAANAGGPWIAGMPALHEQMQADHESSECLHCRSTFRRAIDASNAENA
jgi:hypothetical protein